MIKPFAISAAQLSNSFTYHKLYYLFYLFSVRKLATLMTEKVLAKHTQLLPKGQGNHPELEI
jgi:hypothetical protein